MASLSCQFHSTSLLNSKNVNRRRKRFIFCSAQPTQNNIKVVINGATKEIGRAAVVAVTKARGMEVAGAVDTCHVGEDIGKICGMEEPLEIPIINDLTMILGSISQGVLVAPTLSIGSILLQQAAISASFHYSNVEIVESRANANDLPSADANQIANNLSNLGQIYNREDPSTDVLARGQVLGDGIRVHSMVLPGIPSSTTVHFSGPGEVYSIKHDITDVKCLMPGLLLAIRKVVRLKNLVYGLEKFI
ncbi:dihydrodipicolinate reductase-like protein CRR1, chloroplastic isoform X4 [Glycine soja]|uniref:dihydrodipicolinate reductase-like protein CRR1, chloroplastic isoform X4 n=1 Tax=Glycine max TaxID=3847 RepID=UPI0007193721|nr:dihydrodipicolinate reductase-like protein CRR1, chloroplastic isoform X4 [Glycine max]XP_028222779.1 dihydrodipicolinate reductase-like protein CRR1, chloroplastic isoform X4 [Glycine soja]|eukprot:XP_014628536.1 dihydrodipicolinate reductase-like protein CRR1, chloroplastic isoform X4 [Glycine max]